MYGHRQNMDITNPDYLRYSERVIRKLLEVSAHRSCVIGFQLDNETKYYGIAEKNVQEAFVRYLRQKFDDDLDAMNAQFGLDYWSNRINAWEDSPDVTAEELSAYRMVITPALYAVSEELIGRLRDYASAGGVLVATYKTGFANEYVKVYHDLQPHGLTDVFGLHYHEFTFPKQVGLFGELLSGENAADIFMELLETDTAEVLLNYAHAYWKEYAAVTRNRFGDGMAYYIGCGCEEDTRWLILKEALRDAQIEIPKERYPLIRRTGTNDLGKQITYYLNYSGEETSFVYDGADGMELISGEERTSGQTHEIGAWNLCIVEA